MSKHIANFKSEVQLLSATAYHPYYGYRRHNDAKLLKNMNTFFKSESERFRRIVNS